MREDLIDIVSRWYSTGHISPDEKAILKAEYLLQLNYTPGCTICAAFWSDVKQYFWYNLKSLNLLPVKTTIRKHIILGSGMLMLPGSSTVYINEGEETEDRKILTDAGADEILAQFPSYSTLIGINPVWQAREDILAEEGESTSDDENSEADSDEDETSDTALADLQAKYETLVKEHDQTKQDLSVTKGMLTKANNKLAKLQEPAPVTPAPAANTLPSAEATNVSTDANPPTKVATQGTGASGTADTGISATSGESTPGDLASSTQETIDQSQA